MTTGMNARGRKGKQAVAIGAALLLGGLLIHPIASSARPDCGWGGFSDQHPPGSCWRPFSAKSPFNRLLAASPQQPRNSASAVATVAASGPGPMIIGGIADTADDYSHPIYFSSRNNPVFTVDCVEFGGQCEVDDARVRIPDLARPAFGDDAHLAVIDQRHGWEYDFWQVRDKPSGGGRLEVSWGGRTPIGTENAKGLGAAGTAAGFALSAGIVRPAELSAGEIDHALFMTVPCTNGHSVYPAGEGVGADCGGPDAPAMGQRFYLEMTKREIDALGIKNWQRTILHAMRRYGLFVGDTGGSGWGFKVESGTSATSFGRPDPWAALGRKLRVPSYVESDGTTRYTFDLAQAVDWASELRVASPCVSRGRC